MLKLSRHQLILLILGVVFLLLYSYLNLVTPQRFNSPDEMTNYFWLERWTADQELQLFEKLNPEVGNVIHPRSTNINILGEIVPGAFLGFILIYGSLAKIFSLWLVKFLTPILAVIAVWCLYGIVKQIFSARIALISSVLLFLLPPWWYYAARGFLPNVAFVSLLIIGFWFLTLKSEIRNWKLEIGSYLLGGLFIGSALIIRPSEIIWLGVVFLGLVIVYYKKVNWLGLILFLAIIILLFIPVLSLQQSLYGDYLTTGYSQLNAEVGLVGGGEVQNFILPFGFHPKTAFLNSWHYYMKMLWWYFWPLVIALIWFLGTAVGSWRLAVSKPTANSQQPTANQWVYLFIFAFIMDWLMIYYGSWLVRDNISGHQTIGTSYLRYWLPAFVASLPLIAWLIVKIFNWFKERLSKILVGVIIFGLIICLSANLVLISEEGLIAVACNINHYQKVNQAAQKKLDENSIIISDRSDKIFWPEFRVAVFLGDFTVFKKLAKVVDRVPVYYYSHNQLTDENLNYLNKNIQEFGLVLEKGISLNGEGGLYELKVIER